MDVVKICEVVDGCEDCPKYGDDCDGDKMTEHTEYISRADAIEAVRKLNDISCDEANRLARIQHADMWKDDIIRNRAECYGYQKAMEVIEALPSADVEPTVIRSKTLLPTKDFKEWAKRIREVNPNAVVIPCDAEVVSAVQGEWIPVSERLPSESDDYICTIPLDADETYTEVLTFHKGRFYEDDDEWGATYHDDVLAWMPLPKPYREETTQRR